MAQTIHQNRVLKTTKVSKILSELQITKKNQNTLKYSYGISAPIFISFIAPRGAIVSQMKPLPINQKHALFHSYKGNSFFFKEKINKMKEGRKLEISFICYKNIRKSKAKTKQQQHVWAMEMVVSLPGLISPDTKMKGPVPKQIN